MTEGFPCDHTQFAGHPDIQGLQGPDRNAHDHLDGDASATIDVIGEARVLIDLDTVPVGGVLTVTVLNSTGQEEEVSFVRGPEPERSTGPSWRIRILQPDDTFSEELAEVRGSGIIGSSWLRMGQVCEGLGLAYAVVRRISPESADDVPDDSYWKEVFVPISDLSAEYIELGLAREFIERDEKGVLRWNLPYVSERISRQIVRARVTHPNTEGSPPTA